MHGRFPGAVGTRSCWSCSLGGTRQAALSGWPRGGCRPPRATPLRRRLGAACRRSARLTHRLRDTSEQAGSRARPMLALRGQSSAPRQQRRPLFRRIAGHWYVLCLGDAARPHCAMLQVGTMAALSPQCTSYTWLLKLAFPRHRYPSIIMPGSRKAWAKTGPVSSSH